MTVKQLWIGMALALAALLGLAASASAQQPTQVNPTARSVQEKQLLDALKPEPGATSAISGRISIPDRRAGNLIQPAGRDWREWHQDIMPLLGAAVLLGMMLAIGLFYLVRGKVRIEGGPSGQTVERFNFLERFAHWLSAISFIALGLSGLNLVFGKRLLLPIIGPETFANLTQAGKLVHNYVSFAFALGVLIMFVLWVKDNFPHPRDIIWLLKGGGLIGNWHAPAGRFNLGQKLIFWTVVAGGFGLSVTGYMMMFPSLLSDLGGLQLAVDVHGIIAVVMIAIIIAHIYIGTVGMEGAFAAMGRGKVDVRWARNHHSVWAEKVLGHEKAPPPKGGKAAAPAE